VAIARALAVEPDVLIADEPTSMLDVSIRMGILTLLDRLRRERGLAILLITHDLASAAHLASRVLVLLRGRVVEAGPTDEVLRRPAHPYTRALIGAIADASGDPSAPVEGRGADVAEASPRGCPFTERCAEVHDPCYTIDPEPRRVASRHVVRCHLHSTESATGVGTPGS